MTIPASLFVDVNTNVLAAVGNQPVLSGLLLTQNSLSPNGQILNFPTAQDVGLFFGFGSDEYDLANRVYFQGYNRGILKPGNILFYKYNTTDSQAYLMSGYLDITLTELQSYSGSFNVTVDGSLKNTGPIDLSTAISFSDAANIIGTGLNLPGLSVIVTWLPDTKRFLIETISTGITATITFATDDISSTLAENLLLTMNSGAVLSQGAGTDTPSSVIQNIVSLNAAWFSISTLWEPVQADKILFSSAISSQENYLYVCYDTDPDTVVADSTTNTSYLINQAGYNNTMMVSGYAPDLIPFNKTLFQVTRDASVFAMGFTASVDFNQINGRQKIAYQSLAGLIPTVTSIPSAVNLSANGYNYYGSVANATNDWIFFYNGLISGKYIWLDSFYGAVYLAKQMQTQLMELLINTGTIPYNEQGFSLIRTSLNDVINDAVNFGTVVKGITLSNEQISIVNAQAGKNISGTLQTNGWYLQILAPSQADQALRKSPIINFWYTDGESVQLIFVNAVDIL